MKETPNNELSIVMPVFNEAYIIHKIIQDIHTYTIRWDGDVEIIAVNDGSTDNTLTILNQMSYSLPNLKVVSHPHNKGYGSALRSGIKASDKAWILLMDSDGQFRIDSLGAIWPYRNHYDLCLGYRQRRTDNPYRLAMGKIGNTLSNIFLGHSIRDINCGFKLFKKDLLDLLTLSSNGGIINFEILYRLFKHTPSLTLHQFSIEHYPRQAGKSTGGNPNVICRIVIEGIRVLLNRASRHD